MKRRSALLAVIVAVGLLAAACGGSSGSGSKATTTKPASASGGGKLEKTDVTVATFLTGAASADVFAAEELGYFKEAGLKVNFKNVGLPGNLMPVLSTGDADFAFSGYEVTLNAINGGIDLVMLREIARNTKGALQLFVSPKSGIKSVADLKGKSVGVPSKGGFGDFILGEALKTKGMTLKDIDLREVPPPVALPQLQKGDLDAAWLPAEFAAGVQADPTSTVKAVLDFQTIPALKDVGIGSLIAPRSFVDKNPNTTAAFTKAVDKAAAKMTTDLALSTTVFEKYAKLAPATIKKLPVIPYTGKVPEAKLATQQKEFVKLGVLRKPVDLSKVIYAG